LLVLKRLANPVDDAGRGGGANVGQVQAFFQLVEEAAIDPALETKQRGHAAEDAAGLGQPLLDLVEQCAEYHFATSWRVAGACLVGRDHAPRATKHAPLNSRKLSHSSAANEQVPIARLGWPGPWQSLPPVTARPRVLAQSRSCWVHFFLKLG